MKRRMQCFHLGIFHNQGDIQFTCCACTQYINVKNILRLDTESAFNLCKNQVICFNVTHILCENNLLNNFWFIQIYFHRITQKTFEQLVQRK